MHGDAPIYEALHEARDRAPRPPAPGISKSGQSSAPPVDALIKLATEVKADLLVVGDVGLDSVAGRLLGSVPADVARKAKIDILIVHTAG
jgi:nucleotide-binding universal stress UspA family protein